MSNEHILVLEDHAELCAQIEQVLVGAGYRVTTALTGAQALCAAQATPFDLLVADVFLPDQSGIEIFTQLHTSHPDLAGIVITGYSTWEMAMEALRAGFVGFLAKPFVPEQLVTSVVTALEQEKLRRENARLRALVPLYELSHAFMGTVGHRDLVKQIIAFAQKETAAEAVSLMLFDADRRELQIDASVGLPAEVVERQRRTNGHGIAGYVAATGKPVIIADGVPLDPEIRDLIVERSEILSSLSLPLVSRGRTIGVLNLSRLRGGESFTPGDLELATVLAGQAAISIENAHLFDQLKLLTDTSQQLARTMDLDEAMNVIVAAPAELIQARGAALWLSESSQEFKLARSLGLDSPPPVVRDQIAERFRPDGSNGWITIPLRHGEKTLGALDILVGSANPPGEERLESLRTLAHAASATLESHRLRTRQVRALHEVDRAVRSDLSVRQQLERLLEQMVNACDAENGSLFLWNQAEDHLETWVKSGKPVQQDLARAVIREGRVGFLTDEHASNEMAMGAPMRVGNRIEGAAVLTRSKQGGPFTSSQLDLLSTLTSSAALIVRNTQLYARSEEAAIAEERTRIAREIHDGLAQDLSFLVLKATAAQKLLGRGEERDLLRELREITEQLRQDAREVRRVIFALRPLDMETLGFQPALDKFVNEFAQANDIETHLVLTGDVTHLPPKLETALFRLTQEALNNIRKHAHARQAWVDLCIQEKIAHLSVRDDGSGFDVESAARQARARGSVGLIQMRERAERAGGIFRIEAQPGQGTSIQVELPVREL